MTKPRTGRSAATTTTTPATSAVAHATPDATPMVTVSATTPATTTPANVGAIAFGNAANAAHAAIDAHMATPATPATPAPLAIVPVVGPATPELLASRVLRAVLAGDTVDVEPDAWAMAIAYLERPVGAASTATPATPRTNNRGRVSHQSATERATVVAAGLPGRQIYNARVFGPFIVGASNASGGAVVRDTRLPGANDATGNPVCDVYATSHVSDALAWVAANHPWATLANATPDATARVNARRVAR